ncbi:MULTISPECIES: DUF2878 domain-containing protein [unclassified Vibrio]|uniref:DUF2878 domain-containing protein n=1 Tax=unclassified Vibrio TaxID=2614977 RepID=UPI001482C48C|nr:MULTISPECIES: DUF2878 domain-containing protein [unclassified Vibrio]NNN43573.1 DUF2878 domain-containing protein [Vibrio sp. 1-1(7)]NNN71397.1 DUF2878 domain-containing protein [Vibrio sp. 12-2(3-a)]
MRSLLWSSLWFEVIWLCAVLGQTNWQGVTLGLVLLTWLTSVYYARYRIFPVLVITIIGITLDMANHYFALFIFAEATWIPLWLIALWGGFAWYSQRLLSVVCTYPRLWVMFLGGLGGALSYWAGYRFGAVTLVYPVSITLGILFIQWFLLTFFLLKVFTDEMDSRYH